MAIRWLQRLVLAVVILCIILAIAWKTSPDPRVNPASFEPQELVLQLAPRSQAITLAQVTRPDASVATLLVTALEAHHINAVDISSAASIGSTDPFAVLGALTAPELESLATQAALQERFAIRDLLAAAPSGKRHIGAGTNFPEHAEEAASDSVFQFPKFGAAMPARSSVESRPGVLLDYEVELCLRFDRAIRSAQDFDAAVKGLFLCGDFTDRGKLLRLIDLDNFDSGSGFSDAKSRADFYPAGALLVVPEDWQSFVANERMTTLVNGERRQDARGGEMTLDFRALSVKALGDMEQKRFLYRDAYYALAPQPAITPDMTVMSGTAEGVIFTQPTRGDIIEGVTRWLFSAGWARGEAMMPALIEYFLASELASGHFLQPGDTVVHRSSHLGDIVVTVTEPGS